MKFRVKNMTLPEGVYADLFQWPDLTVLVLDEEQVARVTVEENRRPGWHYDLCNDLLRRSLGSDHADMAFAP